MSLQSSNVNQEVSLIQKWIDLFNQNQNIIKNLPAQSAYTGGPSSYIFNDTLQPQVISNSTEQNTIRQEIFKIDPNFDIQSASQGISGIKGLQDKLNQLMIPTQARIGDSSNTIPPIATPSVPVQARQEQPSLFSSAKPLIIFGIVIFSAVTILLPPKSKRK